MNTDMLAVTTIGRGMIKNEAEALLLAPFVAELKQKHFYRFEEFSDGETMTSYKDLDIQTIRHQSKFTFQLYDEGHLTGPKVVPVTTQYNNKMLNLMGLAIPNQPTSSAPGCICTGARNGVATILSFTPSPLGMGPGTETIVFFQEAMTPQEFIRMHRDQRETALALRALLKGG